MKKILFLLLLTFSLSNAFSQSKKGDAFGLKAGINLSSIKASDGTTSQSTSNATNFNIGVYGTFSLNKTLLLQPEFFINGEGGTDDGTTFNLTYINLPILLKYNVKNTGLSFIGGPQLGFLMSAKINEDGDVTDVKSQFKTTQLSGILGVQYTSQSGFGIDFRNQFSLSKVFTQTISSTQYSLRSNLISFGVFYRIK